MQAENGRNETKHEIRSIAFFDIEATGLPSEEFNRTKITEISFVACSTEHLLATKFGDLPRILHKLTLCMNPAKRISDVAEKITGLSNELLEHENKFDENLVRTMFHFLSHLQKPCVIVAHNGLRFDFPILQRMLMMIEMKLPEDLLAADSLLIFREIDAFEEFQKAEESVRPLSPSMQTENDLPDQNSITPQYCDDNNEDEKAIDEFIAKELKVLCPEVLKNQTNIPKDLTPNELRVMNELTPVKQLKAKNINSSPDGPHKSDLGASTSATPHSTEALIEKFNENRKRLRENPPRSRRDLFGAKKLFNLPEIHQRCFNSKAEQSHYAEGDVMTLLKCAIAKKENFVRILQERAISFNEIPALGKK
uniref:CSON003226 protein n=1 Tax=Culicoides sonorensis TaxID=179676 RepID=A0A336KCU1_CULSO